MHTDRYQVSTPRLECSMQLKNAIDTHNYRYQEKVTFGQAPNSPLFEATHYITMHAHSFL